MPRPPAPRRRTSRKNPASPAARAALRPEASVLEALPRMAWLAAADGRIERANVRWREGTAAAHSTADPGDWLAAVHPEDRPLAREAWTQALESGQPMTVECRLVLPEENHRWFRVEAGPLREAADVVVGWLGMATDVDDVRRREAVLQFLTETSRSLLAPTPPASRLSELARRAVPALADGFVVHLHTSEVEWRCLAVVNTDPARTRQMEALPADVLARLAGVEEAARRPGEILVRPEPGQASPPADPPVAEAWRELGLRSVLAAPVVTREGVAAVLTFLAADSGRQFTAADGAAAEDLAARVAVSLESRRQEQARQAAEARADQGRVVTAYFEESSRQEQVARVEAEAANRAKDEFLAMISHELRTPLGAILIWSQLLRNEKLDEEGTLRAIGMIERSTKTLAKIIDDILDVSRIISGKLRLEARTIELGPVIEAAAEAARPEAEAKGVALEKRIEPERLSVSGDAVRLQQVVGNLLANAIKFTPQGGRVEVRMERVGGNVRVVVTDTGIGIHPDFLPHVFERFRQADSTSTRRHKGLGLGLAIARHLIEMHGGKVEAASEGENQGSTFSVIVPLLVVTATESSAVARAEEWPPDARTLEGLAVLLVDDEDDARDALALLLERSGARVTSARSAQEAFEALQARPHDVLLSDIAMPVEDGYSLLERVRQLPAPHGQVPAAAVTAYATREDRERALRAGYAAHLAKPVNPAALVGVVLRLTGRPNLAPLSTPPAAPAPRP